MSSVIQQNERSLYRRLAMEKRIWQTAGEEVPGQRNVSAAGRFELHECTTFTSIERHHVGATPPNCIAHAY